MATRFVSPKKFTARRLWRKLLRHTRWQRARRNSRASARPCRSIIWPEWHPSRRNWLYDHTLFEIPLLPRPVYPNRVTITGVSLLAELTAPLNCARTQPPELAECLLLAHRVVSGLPGMAAIKG